MVVRFPVTVFTCWQVNDPSPGSTQVPCLVFSRTALYYTPTRWRYNVSWLSEIRTKFAPDYGNKLSLQKVCTKKHRKELLKNNGENQATLSQKVYPYTTKLDQAAPPDRGKVPYCCERKWVVSLSVKLGADGTLTCILSKDNGFLSLLQIHRTEPPEHRNFKKGYS